MDRRPRDGSVRAAKATLAGRHDHPSSITKVAITLTNLGTSAA
jgi:hypothetical protein